MKIFTTITETKTYTAGLKNSSRGAGLVPTMGALHEGHISLVRRSVRENEITGVSIFVNPIQFNNPADLEKYPRTLETDIEMLSAVMGPDDYVFAPSVAEMYPEPDTRIFDFGPLATVMEGRFRPGHFNGVGIVVSKLFHIMNPDRAYFGEKDFQQLAIIRRLVEIEALPVSIVPCPIIREPDGLAMSSRNVRLTAEHRQAAPMIFKAMQEALALVGSHTPEELKHRIKGQIDGTGLLVTEYVEFAHETTLQPIDTFNTKVPARCFIAVQAGDVRLIDNVGVTRIA
jgi:pantoate--beta-alanine ligase